MLEEVDNKEKVRVKEVKTKIALSIRPSKVLNQNACFLSVNIKGSQKSKHHSILLVKIGMARRNRKEQTRRSDGVKSSVTGHQAPCNARCDSSISHYYVQEDRQESGTGLHVDGVRFATIPLGKAWQRR